MESHMIEEAGLSRQLLKQLTIFEKIVNLYCVGNIISGSKKADGHYFLRSFS